jgi:hypothetical protein
MVLTFHFCCFVIAAGNRWFSAVAVFIPKFTLDKAPKLPNPLPNKGCLWQKCTT